MADNYQRSGSVSNSQVGRDFEQVASRVLAAKGIATYEDFTVPVGAGSRTKIHRFDLGADSPAVLVECKSHKWTSGGNVPSAKMTVWNEAMFYFHCAPSKYRKILFVLRDVRESSGESLSAYYIRRYGHLVPEDVEIWEYDEESGECEVVFRP